MSACWAAGLRSQPGQMRAIENWFACLVLTASDAQHRCRKEKKNIFTSYKKYHRDVGTLILCWINTYGHLGQQWALQSANQSASYHILFLGRFLNAITENKVTYSLKIHTIDATTKMLVNLVWYGMVIWISVMSTWRLRWLRFKSQGQHQRSFSDNLVTSIT